MNDIETLVKLKYGDIDPGKIIKDLPFEIIKEWIKQIFDFAKNNKLCISNSSQYYAENALKYNLRISVLSAFELLCYPNSPEHKQIFLNILFKLICEYEQEQ